MLETHLIMCHGVRSLFYIALVHMCITIVIETSILCIIFRQFVFVLNVYTYRHTYAYTYIYIYVVYTYVAPAHFASFVLKLIEACK